MMTSLASLWLPIVLSAVIVFIASSIIHMVLPWHKSDYLPVPQEAQVMDALRPFAIPPGDYMMPRCSDMGQMRSPEFLEKMSKGPVLVMTVFPSGPMSMNRSLALWFLYCVVVGLFAGYVACSALPPGAPYLKVFRISSTVAFVGYVFALWQMSIWYRRDWITTLKSSVDGLIYALLTGGVFGWLWP